MNKKRILVVLAVIAVIIPLGIGIHMLIKKNQQQQYEKRQLEYRESMENYVPNIDMDAYFKEKERWDIEPSVPVSDYGMMNVNGDTYYFGMTMQEVIDFGYPYSEYLDEGNGSGLGSLVLYYNEDDKEAVTPAMMNLTFRLREGGDPLSYDDYELGSINLNEYCVSGRQQEYYTGRLSHNAEIIHGIHTDMTYEEVMAILEPLGEQVEVHLGHEASPYVTMKVTMGECIYILNFRELRFCEMNMFLEEDQKKQNLIPTKIKLWFYRMQNFDADMVNK